MFLIKIPLGPGTNIEYKFLKKIIFVQCFLIEILRFLDKIFFIDLSRREEETLY
jgi:hypothetical protein